MNCKSVRKRLPLFVDGDLPRWPSQRIVRHLQSCESCRAEAQSHLDDLCWLRAQARAAPQSIERLETVRLHARLMDAIAATPRPLRFNSVWLRRLALPALGLALVWASLSWQGAHVPPAPRPAMTKLDSPAVAPAAATEAPVDADWRRHWTEEVDLSPVVAQVEPPTADLHKLELGGRDDAVRIIWLVPSGDTAWPR